MNHRALLDLNHTRDPNKATGNQEIDLYPYYFSVQPVDDAAVELHPKRSNESLVEENPPDDHAGPSGVHLESTNGQRDSAELTVEGKPTTTRALPMLTAIRRKMPNQCLLMKRVQHQTKNCNTSSNVGHHGARQERRSCATTAAGEWPSLRTPSHRFSLIPPYVRHRTRSQIGITSSSKTYPMVTGTYATRSLPHACATEKSSN